MLEEELQQLVLRSSQQAGGDLASKLQLARVMDELDEQRRTHATQVCRVCARTRVCVPVCLCVCVCLCLYCVCLCVCVC